TLNKRIRRSHVWFPTLEERISIRTRSPDGRDNGLAFIEVGAVCISDDADSLVAEYEVVLTIGEFAKFASDDTAICPVDADPANPDKYLSVSWVRPVSLNDLRPALFLKECN